MQKNKKEEDNGRKRKKFKRKVGRGHLAYELCGFLFKSWKLES